MSYLPDDRLHWAVRVAGPGWARLALRDVVPTRRAANSAAARHGRAHHGLSGHCQVEVDLRNRLL